MATIAHVAARARVSKATVSRVVNGTARVRPATKDRVLRAISSLRYQPSSQAQQLSYGRNTRVTIVESRADEQLTPRLVRAISDLGLGVAVTDAEPVSRAAMAAVQSAGGVVALGTRAERVARDLRGSGVPMVATAPGTDALPRVVLDPEPALRRLARALERDGTDLMVLIDDAELTNAQVAALRGIFAPFGIHLLRPMRQDDPATLLDRRRPPDAFLCARASQAVRVYGQLSTRSRVPLIISMEESPSLACLGIGSLIAPLDRAACCLADLVYQQVVLGLDCHGVQIRFELTAP